MAETGSGLPWTESQWQMVNNAAAEAFAKASVSSAVVPCYGPLPGNAENVRRERLSTSLTSDDQRSEVSVDDDTTLRLINLTVRVRLSSQQVADDTLSAALLAFRRAANTIAQAQDDVVFNGYNVGVGQTRTLIQHPNDTQAVVVGNPGRSKGLIPEALPRPAAPATGGGNNAAAVGSTKKPATGSPTGEALVGVVAQAMAALEDHAHPGPFACVLGRELFVDAHTPNGSLVLPADRITPMLGGPLLRSGKMPPRVGLVASLAGGAIDIVVATPLKVQFLQITTDAKYLFRVYERFVLRMKDPQNPGVEVFAL